MLFVIRNRHRAYKFLRSKHIIGDCLFFMFIYIKPVLRVTVRRLSRGIQFSGPWMYSSSLILLSRMDLTCLESPAHSDQWLTCVWRETGVFVIYPTVRFWPHDLWPQYVDHVVCTRYTATNRVYVKFTNTPALTHHFDLPRMKLLEPLNDWHSGLLKVQSVIVIQICMRSSQGLCWSFLTFWLFCRVSFMSHPPSVLHLLTH